MKAPSSPDTEKQALAERKNDLYRTLLGQMSPQNLSSEVKETLDALRKKGMKLAIGSSRQKCPLYSGADWSEQLL